MKNDAQKDESTAGTDMTCQILLIKFLDVSAVLRACCASVHSFLVWPRPQERRVTPRRASPWKTRANPGPDALTAPPRKNRSEKGAATQTAPSPIVWKNPAKKAPPPVVWPDCANHRRHASSSSTPAVMLPPRGNADLDHPEHSDLSLPPPPPETVRPVSPCDVLLHEFGERGTAFVG
ncbi:hypothetical protein PAPYR_11898 [Paratrimastix pyriformis]|uniref:Uncharacterized protein n=1 Tax=Paratrimastix pyriformis TaxID=342808 RepID=A0ABQ8U2U6_9EUKA|nr:hypothetical protein PAPYR_11898 [Paratrimastix pyriformis]